MVLYIQGQKVKVYLNGAVYKLTIVSTDATQDGVILKSSDNYILKDCDGLTLLAKEFND